MARYKDIDLNFISHPVTGDVTTKSDDNAIKQALRNLIMLNFGEIPFFPNKGSGIRALLFQPITNITAINLRNQFVELIYNFEPRIEIETLEMTPNPEQHSYDCYLEYYIKNVENPITFNFTLQRLR